MLGEIEVRWGADEKGFSRRLATVEPFQFYLATLQSLLHRFEHARALEEAYHALYDALRRERNWLESKHQWPAKPPTIEELFAPS